MWLVIAFAVGLIFPSLIAGLIAGFASAEDDSIFNFASAGLTFVVTYIVCWVIILVWKAVNTNSQNYKNRKEVSF